MRGIKCLEQATHIANQLSLFSGNEEVEDVPTTNLKCVTTTTLNLGV